MMKKNYLAPCAEVMLFAPSESIASGQPWWKWNWGTLEVADASANGSKLLIEEKENPWDYSNKDKPY